MLTGIIIATTAIIFAYLGARVWTRVIRPELRPTYEVFGDVVELPPEARRYGPSANTDGGVRARADGPTQKDNIARRHGSAL
jgi:hypothetical protein